MNCCIEKIPSIASLIESKEIIAEKKEDIIREISQYIDSNSDNLTKDYLRPPKPSTCKQMSEEEKLYINLIRAEVKRQYKSLDRY